MLWDHIHYCARRFHEGIIKQDSRIIASIAHGAFGRARRRRGRATLKRVEDPPPSPSIRLGAQGLSIGLACRGSHPSLCVVLCSSASAGLGGWPFTAGSPQQPASAGLSRKMLRPTPSNTCSHERPQRRRKNVKAQCACHSSARSSALVHPPPDCLCPITSRPVQYRRSFMERFTANCC